MPVCIHAVFSPVQRALRPAGRHQFVRLQRGENALVDVDGGRMILFDRLAAALCTFFFAHQCFTPPQVLYVKSGGILRRGRWKFFEAFCRTASRQPLSEKKPREQNFWQEMIDKSLGVQYNNNAASERRRCYPGVAQLVARLTGGQEAACSSHVTRTIAESRRLLSTAFCYAYIYMRLQLGK